jgi:multidrug resistance efflux pump
LDQAENDIVAAKEKIKTTEQQLAQTREEMERVSCQEYACTKTLSPAQY